MLNPQIHVQGMGIFSRELLLDEIERFYSAFCYARQVDDWTGMLTIIESSVLRAYLKALETFSLDNTGV